MSSKYASGIPDPMKRVWILDSVLLSFMGNVENGVEPAESGNAILPDNKKNCECQ